MRSKRLGHHRGASTVAPFAAVVALLLTACSSPPVPSASSAASPTAPTPPAAAATLSPSRLAEGAEVLIIGDSFTEGYGIAPGTDWAHLVADDRGWQATIDGVSGTGFTQGLAADGRTGLDYANRVRRHADAGGAYDLVILQGGLNDLLVPAATERANVAATVQAARTAWPDADVIVFGPTAPFGGGGNRDESGAIRAAATETGAVYIDPAAPSPWFDQANSPDFDLGDRLHLNDAGQAYLAARFVDAVLASVE
ncbi:SGNH/GDSL hydrolase family protein [Agromyces badenianii]|uniref:SGNH/GDSL hydrolase family protein n=1 Tax=Agromyces badenianii TaxID=2080742 RepID=UPI0014049105|nr:SGNH/GDSL hydrolase family protein [Agromyces badenianii]